MQEGTSVEDIDAFKAEFKVKLLVVAFMMMVWYCMC